MGLKLKREDPAEDMRVLRFVLRDTQPPAEARAAVCRISGRPLLVPLFFRGLAKCSTVERVEARVDPSP